MLEVSDRLGVTPLYIAAVLMLTLEFTESSCKADGYGSMDLVGKLGEQTESYLQASMRYFSSALKKPAVSDQSGSSWLISGRLV